MREVLSVLYKIASEEQMKLTIAMMPAKPSKPSTPSSMPYGPVLDRELPLHNFDRRQEAILEEPAVSAKQSSTPSTTSRLQIPASSLPVAFVPQCFASEDDCNKGTNNCTGHGACIVKSKTGTSGSEEEGGSSNCYVCSCNKPEVIKNKDGTTKTTYFGGSACQKKDISAPFWILTLTAGSFLALVGFGISMLYAMGQAELPSVIGAGVSGPRAK